ncbi:esterase-like activity of phytase family protein [Sphingomonas sp. GB1N7]
MRILTTLTLAAASMIASAPAQAITFVNALRIPNVVTGGNDANRFGGFGSDLVYNAADGLYYGMTDRGPGGGLLDYAPRIQSFSLDVATNGTISNFAARAPIIFTRDGVAFSGQNPGLLAGDKAALGRSFDPEGLAIRSNGNFIVSDEYGPSIYEFDSQGRYVRAFTIPANLLPKQADGTPNYVDGRPTITSGRQDNRGFEGLTLSNDGTKAYAILQDPLVNEGPVNGGETQGRRARNLRIVEFDVATGNATAQFAYTLESIADINGRIPGTADDFTATQQGRSIGVSSITQLPDGRFLVIERDNRGWGVDDTANRLPIGSKRVYIVDKTGATDISNISLAGLSALPLGVTAVNKGTQPFLDIQALLVAAGIPIAEKLEGLAFSPMLADGGRALFIISDNDFSVTQFDGSSTQFEYCTSGPEANAVSFTPALGTPCPTGTALIPTFLYSFKLSAAEASALGFATTAVPEPASWAMMIGGFGLVGGAMRRRQRTTVRYA